jgi:RNA polymerase sigma-70 factor (ECF subfamily)
MFEETRLVPLDYDDADRLTPRSAAMPEASTFEELIRRVRAWDQDAAAELVRRYEAAIRRAVRFRMADARLGSLFDSMDICQSVLGSFFVRAASGQYDLESPEKVLGLLVAMARNKLASKARRQLALRRGGHNVTTGIGDRGQFAAPGASPSREVAARDLLQEVRRRLSADELELLDLRNDGHDWSAIAGRVGGAAEALRKKLARALARVAEQLDLDGDP